MAEFTTPQFWLAVVAIVFVNILLSGDNAVVIALACRNLSPRARRQGIFWGVLGAVVLRIVLTFFVMSLLADPWLRLVGAVLLAWIGTRLIAEDASSVRPVADNVMAVAAAAKGDVWLIVFGLGISIPMVVVGSQIIMPLIVRFPLLVYAGGGMLGYIGAEMALDDPMIEPWIAAKASALVPFVPFAGFAAVVAAGLLLVRRRQRAAQH